MLIKFEIKCHVLYQLCCSLQTLSNRLKVSPLYSLVRSDNIGYVFFQKLYHNDITAEELHEFLHSHFCLILGVNGLRTQNMSEHARKIKEKLHDFVTLQLGNYYKVRNPYRSSIQKIKRQVPPNTNLAVPVNDMNNNENDNEVGAQVLGDQTIAWLTNTPFDYLVAIYRGIRSLGSDFPLLAMVTLGTYALYTGTYFTYQTFRAIGNFLEVYNLEQEYKARQIKKKMNESDNLDEKALEVQLNETKADLAALKSETKQRFDDHKAEIQNYSNAISKLEGRLDEMQRGQAQFLDSVLAQQHRPRNPDVSLRPKKRPSVNRYVEYLPTKFGKVKTVTYQDPSLSEPHVVTQEHDRQRNINFFAKSLVVSGPIDHDKEYDLKYARHAEIIIIYLEFDDDQAKCVDYFRQFTEKSYLSRDGKPSFWKNAELEDWAEISFFSRRELRSHNRCVCDCNFADFAFKNIDDREFTRCACVANKYYPILSFIHNYDENIWNAITSDPYNEPKAKDMYLAGLNDRDVPSTYLRSGLISAISTELLENCITCLENTEDNEFCVAAYIADLFIKALPTEHDLHKGLEDLSLAIKQRRTEFHEDASTPQEEKTKAAAFAKIMAFPKEFEPVLQITK